MQRSEQFTEMAKALVLAQAQIKNASKDHENPYFQASYADLAAVWDTCRGPLTSNGISVIQIPSFENGKVSVETVFIHVSGEWFSATLSAEPQKQKPKKQKAPGQEIPDDTAEPIITPQAIGSAITYLRRYMLMSLAGVAPQDEDDDGNAASQPEERTIQRQEDKRPISEAQQKRLWAIAKQKEWATDEVKALVSHYGFEGSASITRTAYEDVCRDLETGPTEAMLTKIGIVKEAAPTIAEKGNRS